MFYNILGIILPNWLSYFSEGLKPRTRCCIPYIEDENPVGVEDNYLPIGSWPLWVMLGSVAQFTGSLMRNLIITIELSICQPKGSS